MTSTPTAPRFTPEQHAAAAVLDAAELHYAACSDALDAATTARAEARAAFRATFTGGPVASPFPVLREARELHEQATGARSTTSPDPATAGH